VEEKSCREGPLPREMGSLKNSSSLRVFSIQQYRAVEISIDGLKCIILAARLLRFHNLQHSKERGLVSVSCAPHRGSGFESRP